MAEQFPPPVSVAIPVLESVNEQNPKRRLNFDDDSQGGMAALSVTTPGSAQNTSAALKKLPKKPRPHLRLKLQSEGALGSQQRRMGSSLSP
jgi:hypothetical protein